MNTEWLFWRDFCSELKLRCVDLEIEASHMGWVLCYTLVQFEQVLAEVNNKEQGLETTETARIFNHFRLSRGGHSGRENWRLWTFSRTGETASGMLLLTNQFHNIFEYLPLIGHKKYFCAHSEASIYRAAL